MKATAMRLVGVCLAAVLAVLFWVTARGQEGAVAEPRGVSPRGPLLEMEAKTIALFEQASPSVVYITSVALRRDFFSRNVFEIPQGTGTGFIWDDDGHIVTNFHVIQNSSGVQVTLPDKTSWDAELVGVEPNKELAVLRIDAPREKLKAIRMGTSRNLKVGQVVLAIGNPFGLDQTLTTGVISGLGREIEALTRVPISGVIQTDAAINPGNSGGPLLDSDGRLIGINTAIYSPSGAYAGVGFAVPVDVINQVIPELIAYGRVTQPVLGVNLADTRIARQWGVKGALVMRVGSGTGAEQAGLRPTRRDERGRYLLGDIILAVNGEPVVDSVDIYSALDGMKVGEEAEVVILRDGEEETVKILLTGAK
ncbi:MAG: trypsin-like peptidase domain-containing protein [Verrucomicrobiota bacterium]